MKVKKLVSIFLAMILLVGILPVTGVSATEETGSLGGNRHWKLDRSSGVLTLSGEGEIFVNGGNLAPWAKWAEEIRYIVIEEGITYVSYDAFHACLWVEEISIPSTLADMVYPPSRYLHAYRVAEGNEVYTQIDGVLFSKDGTTLVSVPRGYKGIYIVPDSVTEVEGSAFAGCHGLMEVILPEGITEIKSNTFSDCTSLLRVNLPESVRKIRAGAFENCISLEKIVLPEGLTTLETDAFSGSGLKSATIPDSVVKYGGAFQLCNRLETLIIGRGVNTRLEVDYTYTPSLKKVVVSPYNTAYYCDERGVLYDKEKKTLLAAPMGIEGEYTVLPGVESVYTYAFTGCYKLSAVELPNSLCNIMDNAFSGCYKLKQVNIPTSVRWIGLAAFDRCVSLENIRLPETLAHLGEYAFAGCGIQEVTIPESYRELPDGLFSGCEELENVRIPQSVEYIGSGVFAQCYSLRSLSIPGKDTEVSEEAFGDLFSMESALLAPGGLAALEISPENENFAIDSVGAVYNGDMTHLYLVPATVEGVFTIAPTCESISPYAFTESVFHTLMIPEELVDEYLLQDAYGPNIRKYEVEAGNPAFSADEQGALYNKEMTRLLRVPGGFRGAYDCPDSVSSAAFSAFDGCRGITHVYVGKSFVGMDFVMPDAKWLPNLLVPQDHPECVNDESGVLYSRDMAQLFLAPKDLEGDYTIPETVVLIYGEAFRDCTKLTGIDMSRCRAATLGEHAFAGCTALKWVRLPETMRAIHDGCFMDCTALTAVDLPYGLERIEGAAFENCTALRTVEIPATVRELNNGFWNCTGLRTVRFMGEVPSDFASAFQTCAGETGTETILPKVTVEFPYHTEGYTAPYFSGIPTKVFSASALDCTGQGCGCAEYVDAPEVGHWAHNAIETLLDMGLVNGVGKGRFNPDGTMTRAMLVTVLYRLEGSPAVWDCPFTDVPADAWYTDGVTWAGGMGIVQGYGDGRFDPTAPVTREQVATILSRYMGIAGNQWGRGRASLACFTDEAMVSDYARQPLEAMVMQGIMNGKGIKLDPKGTATRAEVCTILWRLLEFTETP